MKFLDGFLLVNFIPFAVLTILGLILFFIKTRQTEKYYYPLLFIIIILCLVALIRFPFADIARRYTMPLLVPCIIISTFTIILLPPLLKRFKIPYSKAIIRTALAIVLVFCVIKALRVQENKAYLREIADIIADDCKKNNVPKAALLIFGNLGGHVETDDIIDKVAFANKKIGDKFANPEFQLKQFSGQWDIDALKIKYEHLYLLCVEHKPEDFKTAWIKKYNTPPDTVTYIFKYYPLPNLVFEHIRDKDKVAYRLYKLDLTRTVPKEIVAQVPQIIESRQNLLNKIDINSQIELAANDKNVQILKKRGITINNCGRVALPAGWTINPSHGWLPKSGNVTIKFDSNTGNFTIKSDLYVSIFITDAVKLTDNTYCLLNVSTDPKCQGTIQIFAYMYDDNGKYIKAVMLEQMAFHANISKSNSHISHFVNKGYNRIRIAIYTNGEIILQQIFLSINNITQQ